MCYGLLKVVRHPCRSWSESESLSIMSNSLQHQGLYSPWNSPGQNTGVGSLSLLQGIFPTQGPNPSLLHSRQILYQLSHKGSPRILEWVAYPFSRGSSQTKNWTKSPALQADCLLARIRSDQISHSVVSDSLQPHETQHARPPCPSPIPRVHWDSCPSSQWCHPTISSSAVPFFSCLQSFPASGSFPMSQLFTSGGHSIGVSASTSVLPMNTQDWSPLGWTGWISL